VAASKYPRPRAHATVIDPLHVSRLHRDADRNPNAGISSVVEIVAIVGIVDIDIVRVIPVTGPVTRIGIDHAEPVASILEAWISADNEERETADAESMIPSKGSAEVVVWNAISTVSAALCPGAVVGLPVARAVLLPCALLYAPLVRRTINTPRLLRVLFPVLTLPVLTLPVLTLPVLTLPVLGLPIRGLPLLWNAGVLLSLLRFALFWPRLPVILLRLLLGLMLLRALRSLALLLPRLLVLLLGLRVMLLRFCAILLFSWMLLRS
jgi:hypothetical protein